MQAPNERILLLLYSIMSFFIVLLSLFSMSLPSIVVVDNLDYQYSLYNDMTSSTISIVNRSRPLLECAQVFMIIGVIMLFISIFLIILSLLDNIYIYIIEQTKLGFILHICTWLCYTIVMSCVASIKITNNINNTHIRWHFGVAFGFLVLSWVLLFIAIILSFIIWQPYVFCIRPKSASRILYISLIENYKLTHQIPYVFNMVINKLIILSTNNSNQNLFFKPIKSVDLDVFINVLEEAGDHLEEEDISMFSPHIHAQFICKFLECLPEPLLTFSRYEPFLRSMDRLEDICPLRTVEKTSNVLGISNNNNNENMNDIKKNKLLLSENKQNNNNNKFLNNNNNNYEYMDRRFFIQSLILSLPKAHVEIFRLLFELLVKISKDNNNNQQQKDNDILNSTTVTNLSILFAPLILRPNNNNNNIELILSPIDQAASQQLVAFLIYNYQFLMYYNPLRELYDRALEFDILLKRTILLEEKEKQRIKSENALRLRVSYLSFNRRCLVRHFFSWRTFVRTKRDVVEKQYFEIVRLNTLCNSQHKQIVNLEKNLSDMTHDLDMQRFHKELENDSLIFHDNTNNLNDDDDIELPDNIEETNRLILALQRDMN